MSYGRRYLNPTDKLLCLKQMQESHWRWENRPPVYDTALLCEAEMADAICRSFVVECIGKQRDTPVRGVQILPVSPL